MALSLQRPRWSLKHLLTNTTVLRLLFNHTRQPCDHENFFSYFDVSQHTRLFYIIYSLTERTSIPINVADANTTTPFKFDVAVN